MIRNKKLTRSIAIFFILEMVANIAVPFASYALTAGPTAPEYSSFEPVDTTDMVNLATGDLVYNIPLLEVPGPSGGYPLSLSYHAGIKPNQEASWVGLGWTLNPGAINRMVNGYPDDHFHATRTTRDYWQGGSTTAYSAGVGVSGVNASLTVATDTYRGMGVGVSVGYGYKMGSANLNVGVGVGPYGGAGANLGVSLVRGYMGVGLSTDFKSVSANGNIGNSMLGLSMSTNDTKPKASVAGMNIYHKNAFSGNISSKNSGFGVTIPLGYVSVSLGYSYQRYWTDESYDFRTDGILNSSRSISDSYLLHDPEYFLESESSADPEKAPGGAFPATDNYAVLGQGIGGTISPYIFDNLSTHRVRNGNQIKYKTRYTDFGDLVSNVVNKVSFRFHNDFSNTLTFEDPKISFKNTNSDFSQNLTYSSEHPNVKSAGFNEYKQQLAGSKHVEWYSVKDIIDGSATLDGLVVSNLESVVEEMNIDYINKEGNIVNGQFSISQQIGGYKIINNSGVTYHYSQPVYTFGEFTEINNYEKETWRREVNPHPYAYTWLLTAVTGPDYADRNNNGFPDNGDWGYWVSFNYGKWTEEYTWRNPAIDENIDIDQDIKQYSIGKKELYYLNTIKTASHTAVFEKKWRSDGKGVVDYKRSATNSFEGYSELCGNLTSHKLPVSPLRLDKIYLYKNSDYAILGGDGMNELGDNSNPVVCEDYKISKSNIIDFEDVNENFTSKAIKIIDLGYSYKLQPNTSNSYFPFGQNPDDPNSTSNNLIPNLNGKLTLERLKFFGKGGVSVLPPTIFDYDKNPSYNKDAYDIWGYYKSDFNKNLLNSNVNIARLVTSISSKNVDAWSLSSIQNALGSEIHIEYASDYYDESKLQLNASLSVKSVEVVNNELKIEFHEDVPLDKIFILSSSFKIKLLARWISNITDICLRDGESTYLNYEYKTLEDLVTVSSVANDYLLVTNNNLINKLTNGIGSKTCFCPSNLSGQSLNQNYVYDDPPRIDGGNVIYNISNGVFGGGLKVNNIQIKNMEKMFTTEYTYSNGVTSYEPMGMDKVYFEQQDFVWDYLTRIQNENEQIYAHSLNNIFSKLLINAREIPPPGVVYGNVKVDQNLNGNKIVGSKSYEFQTFEEDFVEYSQYDYSNVDNHYFQGMATITVATQSIYADIQKQSIRFRNFTSHIGNLNKVNTYDNNDNILSERINYFLYDGKTNDDYRQDLRINYKNQGVVHQLFNEYRIIEQDESSRDMHLAMLSIREEYPSLLYKTTFKDYKNQLTESVENEVFDFYSGNVTKTVSKDSYNNSIISETTPAYKKYPGMGLAVNGGANMLIQNAESKQYLINFEDDPFLLKLLNASVQTWSNDVKNLAFGENSEFEGELFKVDNAWFVNSSKLLSIGKKYEISNDYSYSSFIPIVESEEPGYRVKVFSNSSAIVGLIKSAESYKKHRSYTFIGNDNLSQEPDGLLPYLNFYAIKFDAWEHDQEPTSDQWQKNSEITLYDVYSHALEAKDVNGNFAATKMDIDHEQVYSTAANAQYHEFGYSGFENMRNDFRFSGEITLGVGDAGLRKKSNGYKTHTGDQSVEVVLDGGFAMYYDFPENIDRTRDYRVSVWVHEDNKDQLELFASDNRGVFESFIASDLSEERKAGEWYLANMDVSLSGSIGTVRFGCRSSGGSGLTVDDFRFHPIDATMTSYVYNKWGEVSHILDANNIFTEYEYDGMGRLKSTNRETFDHDVVKTSEHKINYGRGEKVVINATSTGNTGYIDPLGDISLYKGGEITFSTLDIGDCSNPLVERVLIDGIPTTASKTLSDGTLLNVLNNNFTFSNIKSNHQIHMEFRSLDIEILEITCHRSDFNQDTPNCRTGRYNYSYRDECGIIRSIRSVTGSSIPGYENDISNLPDCTRDCDGPVEEI